MKTQFVPSAKFFSQLRAWKFAPVAGYEKGLSAFFAGANPYRQMHEFIRIHLQRLNEAFGLRLPYSPS